VSDSFSPSGKLQDIKKGGVFIVDFGVAKTLDVKKFELIGVGFEGDLKKEKKVEPEKPIEPEKTKFKNQ